MKIRTSKKIRRGAGQVCLHVFFTGLCFLTLIPVLYAVSVSLNAENSLLGSNFRFIPESFTLKNYLAVFTDYPVMLWLKNSMILAAATLAMSLTVGVPAAYVFSRRRFAGRNAILKALILLYSFPSVLSMFAIYKLLGPIGLVDNRLGLILIYAGTMAVFALLNMKGYFDSIPQEIEEAASIDGAGSFSLVSRVVM